jgi:hypothetical protein
LRLYVILDIFILLFFSYYFIMAQTIGSRRQVWNGTAKKTSGGLTKSDLMMSHGRIVSKSKHFTAKKEMRLLKYGYGTKKGKFGFVKIGTKKQRKGRKKMKGGMSSLNPADANASYMIKDVVAQAPTPLSRSLTGGGRGSRRMAMGMAGGSGLKPLNEGGDANWAGDQLSGAGITNFGAGSTDVQIRAGMSGGRKRKSKSKCGKMRGGTINRSHNPGIYPDAVVQRSLLA